jgi:hypothetical protein
MAFAFRKSIRIWLGTIGTLLLVACSNLNDNTLPSTYNVPQSPTLSSLVGTWKQVCSIKNTSFTYDYTCTLKVSSNSTYIIQLISTITPISGTSTNVYSGYQGTLNVKENQLDLLITSQYSGSSQLSITDTGWANANATINTTIIEVNDNLYFELSPSIPLYIYIAQGTISGLTGIWESYYSNVSASQIIYEWNDYKFNTDSSVSNDIYIASIETKPLTPTYAGSGTYVAEKGVLNINSNLGNSSSYYSIFGSYLVIGSGSDSNAGAWIKQ